MQAWNGIQCKMSGLGICIKSSPVFIIVHNAEGGSVMLISTELGHIKVLGIDTLKHPIGRVQKFKEGTRFFRNVFLRLD